VTKRFQRLLKTLGLPRVPLPRPKVSSLRDPERRRGHIAGRPAAEVRTEMQRDHGALAAFTQKRGRPEVDPRDREVARLRKELSRAEAELDKARKVIEIQSNCPRSWRGSQPRARRARAG
jgi:hypothetical protein